MLHQRGKGAVPSSDVRGVISIATYAGGKSDASGPSPGSFHQKKVVEGLPTNGRNRRALRSNLDFAMFLGNRLMAQT
jgi:hypothetical protein